MSDPVAFLYENEGYGKELVFDCNGEHARRLLELGYTEMPLFATPDPRITQLEADRAEAVTLLNRANEALNSAFAQADAEANGHDKIADRHSAVVRQFQSDVRATLSRIGEDGK